MSQLNPYISFNDNCREAMTFYKECFGGKLDMQVIGESPLAKQMPPEAQNKILHATLTTNDFVLMASEMQKPGMANPKESNISLCLNCKSEEEITRLYNYLSNEGKVICELGKSFWGSTFGEATDKFGVNWVLNFEKNQ